MIFIASMASLFALPQVIGYAAAKSAYVGMVRTLASDVSIANVRVNAIAPGWIDSAKMRQALAGDSARQAKGLGRVPMGRFGEAEDIDWAMVPVFGGGEVVTGVVLLVDGGARHRLLKFMVAGCEIARREDWLKLGLH